MNLRHFCFLVTVMISALMSASPVYWDLYSATGMFYSEFEGKVIEGVYADAVPGVMYHSAAMSMSIQRDSYAGGKLTFSANETGSKQLAADWALFVMAEMDEVLTWDYFANKTRAVQNGLQGAGGKYDSLVIPDGSSFAMHDGEECYMAVLFWADSDLTGYSWIQFACAGGELQIMADATTFQEGLIVGRGNSPNIPEPSGGLLFLLGGAALVLRRRKRTPVGVFLTSRGDGPGR